MSQTVTVIESQSAIVGAYVRLEVTVTSGGTFRVGNLTQIQGIIGMRMKDWSIVTFTFVGNIATVATPGLLNDRIIVVAGGLQ